MREAVIILLVVFVLLALTAVRYRKQLMTAVNIWRMMRQMQKPVDGRLREEKQNRGPLVRCSKCGDWVPENRAIKLGRGSFFCSAECVERTATPA